MGSDDTGIRSPQHSLCPVGSRQLEENFLNVILDRVYADIEQVGNLLIGFPVVHPLNDLNLAGGEGSYVHGL
jgi:hypothetical protein